MRCGVIGGIVGGILGLAIEVPTWGAGMGCLMGLIVANSESDVAQHREPERETRAGVALYNLGLGCWVTVVVIAAFVAAGIGANLVGK